MTVSHRGADLFDFIKDIVSIFSKLFGRKNSPRTKISGKNIRYSEKNIHHGYSGLIICIIITIIILGFVAVVYMHTHNSTDANTERNCKTCELDPHLTNKMLREIRHDPNIAIDIARRSNIDLTRVPDGYFVAFQRIDPLLQDIIDNNVGDLVGIRPDISVSSRFIVDAKKYYSDIYEKRISCKQLYVNPDDGVAQRVPLTCYPIELAPAFDRFFRNVYTELYQKTYVESLKQDKTKLANQGRRAREERRNQKTR